jgi:hypothetical protein
MPFGFILDLAFGFAGIPIQPPVLRLPAAVQPGPTLHRRSGHASGEHADLIEGVAS